jgi:hypothetical protein
LPTEASCSTPIGIDSTSRSIWRYDSFETSSFIFFTFIPWSRTVALVAEGKVHKPVYIPRIKSGFPVNYSGLKAALGLKAAASCRSSSVKSSAVLLFRNYLLFARFFFFFRIFSYFFFFNATVPLFLQNPGFFSKTNISIWFLSRSKSHSNEDMRNGIRNMPVQILSLRLSTTAATAVCEWWAQKAPAPPAGVGTTTLIPPFASKAQNPDVPMNIFFPPGLKQLPGNRVQLFV